MGDFNRLKVPTREAVLHVNGNPAFVLATLQAWPLRKGSATAPDARWVFLAGAEALDLEKDQWPFYTGSKSDQPRWVSSFGRIRDPRIDDLLLALALNSKNAKEEAFLALKSRPDEARAACDRLGAEALAEGCTTATEPLASKTSVASPAGVGTEKTTA